MTVAGAFTRPLSPVGRWIMRRLWWIEHAFERSRASDKAVDDTRLRIFFVLALFAAGFVTLGLGAGKAARFSRYGHGGELAQSMPGARAELTDRNGQTLALDLPNRGESTHKLLRAMTDEVVDAGGRVYPAKDATMPAEAFRLGYPNWTKLEALRDPKFMSDFWRRVTQ